MSYKGETGSMKKYLRARLGRFAAIAAVALCALGLLTGCGDTYYDYDGSGYFTSADGYMRVAYQEHFQQLSSVDKNAIGLDWIDEKVNLQIVRYRKDDEMFTERSVKTLDQFIELYYANGLEYLHKYSTFGDLQEFTFEHFDAAKGYDIDTEKEDVYKRQGRCWPGSGPRCPGWRPPPKWPPRRPPESGRPRS